MKYYVCDGCGMKQEVKLGQNIFRDYDWDIKLYDINNHCCFPNKEGYYFGAVVERHFCPICAEYEDYKDDVWNN